MELIVDRAQYKFLMNILFDIKKKVFTMVKNYKEMCELIVKLIDQLSATERDF